MTIAFFHNGLAFLPELEAYSDFFQQRNIKCLIVPPNQKPIEDFDVEWHFMGTGKRRKKNSILIHEYGSLSVPPASHLKDFIKRQLNEIPDYRIFLNEDVKKNLHFNDNIPHGFRDMGIDPNWSGDLNTDKKFDFIYIGSSSHQRQLNRILDIFSGRKMQQSSLLVLSKSYGKLQKRYSSYSNIIFNGPVGRSEVLNFLKSSRFGLNFLPNTYPFNIQTSSKFLEYCQVKIPVISTDYFWIRTFQKKYGGNYYYLKNDLSNFDKELIKAFPFSFPDLSSWTWEQQILSSGIMDFLQMGRII